MAYRENNTTISGVLGEIYNSSKNSDEVSVEDILNIVGRRSFGPILLVAGLVTLAPLIGDIPGVPTAMATLVFIVALQILFQQEKLWLPDAILSRSIDTEKLFKAMSKIEKPAGYVDRFLKPRLEFFTNESMVYAVAVVCIFISLVTPIMEFIPFSANLAGAALCAFGLSFIAEDGLMALIGYIFSASIAGIILVSLTW